MRPLVAVGLLLLGIATCVNISEACTAEDYEKEEIVPAIINKAPEDLLQVTYSGKNMEFAKEIPARETSEAPSIGWTFDPSDFYTIVMIGPDVPSRADPKFSEFVHWLVMNVPGGDVDRGETIVDYLGLGPPPDTGIHRYLLSLYRQPGRLAFDEKHVHKYSIDGHCFFSQRGLAEKYGLGEPVACNMFKSEYDESVDKLYEQISYTIRPGYDSGAKWLENA